MSGEQRERCTRTPSWASPFLSLTGLSTAASSRSTAATSYGRFQPRGREPRSSFHLLTSMCSVVACLRRHAYIANQMATMSRISTRRPMIITVVEIVIFDWPPARSSFTARA